MQLNFDSFIIQPINPKDAWNLCNFIVANEDRLQSYFPSTLAQNLNPTLSNIFVEKKVKQFGLKEEFLFTIKENESKEFVGLVYIKEVDWTKRQGEFAYCIGYNHEDKGITTKAINILSEYAFSELELETLQIIAHKNNFPSVKVAKNNNFIWRKTLINEFTPMGKKPLNMELYELYKDIK
ncbi:MAG: GNAT family protein [Algibacter sp.]